MTGVAPLATVVILTFNGETYLREILTSVQSQELPRPFEILVIDSGSADATLSILADFPDIRLHTIPNAEFGHGRTRNLAVQLARGEFVVMLTHDATPAHDRWLFEMLRPFEINDRVAAVMGSQVPRPWCFPLLKYEIIDVFRGFGPEFGVTLFYDDGREMNRATRDAVGFFSDVNAAVRRSVVLEEVPYRDVTYAEDQLLGRDLIERGYWKAFAPRASVLHSNDLSWREYDKRLFDETVGLRGVGIAVDIPTLSTVFTMMRRGVLRDTRRLLSDSDYSWWQRLKFVALNPVYHLQKWRGVRRGTLADLSDPSALDEHSLEATRRVVRR